MLTTCMCLDSIMNVYDESEKGKDRNYLYKNAERKKISNSKIIMVIGCGLRIIIIEKFKESIY